MVFSGSCPPLSVTRRLVRLRVEDVFRRPCRAPGGAAWKVCEFTVFWCCPAHQAGPGRSGDGPLTRPRQGRKQATWHGICRASPAPGHLPPRQLDQGAVVTPPGDGAMGIPSAPVLDQALPEGELATPAVGAAECPGDAAPLLVAQGIARRPGGPWSDAQEAARAVGLE